MKRIFKPVIATAATLMAFGAMCAGSAGAATTLGSTCAGALETDGLYFNPSISTAASPGLITSWGVNLNSEPGGPVEHQLLIVEPTGAPDQWRIVSESLMRVNFGSTFTASVSMPIAAGQSIALLGDIPLCLSPGTNGLGSVVFDEPAPGVTFSTNPVDNATVAAWATLEADADGDGFGDETQDKCSLSNLTVGPCVAIKPVATQIPTKNAFKLLLAADLGATATATGTVKLPKTKTSKSKTLTFSSKPQVVTPGVLSTVSLAYPAKLKTALAKLSRTKSLKLSIAVNIDGPLAGAFDAALLNYSQRLKGRAKQ
ncbi:MAG: hypothetical protein ACRDKE_10725 [Solirubrobacterales bacterium]